MNEMIKIWLMSMYSREIEDTKGTISNEHTFELGYDGEEPNPHTENIECLKEYIEVLESLMNDV